jgi:hypothetical protein
MKPQDLHPIRLLWLKLRVHSFLAAVNASVPQMGQTHSHADGHSHGDGDCHGDSHSHGHGHSHSHGHGHGRSQGYDHISDRSKTMMATSGTITALLTAHLADKDRTALEVFIVDAKYKLLPVPISSFTAVISVAGTAPQRSVKFSAAEACERPEGDDKARCSHFVAQTPWLDAASALSVSVSVQLPGAEFISLTWANFVPKIYAYHKH